MFWKVYKKIYIYRVNKTNDMTNSTLDQSILLNAKQLIIEIPIKIGFYVGQPQYDREINIEYKLTNDLIMRSWGVSRGTYYKYLKNPLSIPFEKIELIMVLLAKYEQNLKRK